MPQNLKTDPVETDANGLAPLDANEAVFVEALGQLASGVDAYKKAYGAEGYSPAALRVQACRKMADPKIQGHLRALRAAGLASANLSLKDRIEDELAFMQRCEDAGNMGAAGQARDRVNKLCGLYVERVAVVPDHDPVATLNEIANAIGPDAAAQLARENNIPWTPPMPENRTLQ